MNWKLILYYLKTLRYVVDLVTQRLSSSMYLICPINLLTQSTPVTTLSVSKSTIVYLKLIKFGVIPGVFCVDTRKSNVDNYFIKQKKDEKCGEVLMCMWLNNPYPSFIKLTKVFHVNSYRKIKPFPNILHKLFITID